MCHMSNKGIALLALPASGGEDVVKVKNKDFYPQYPVITCYYPAPPLYNTVSYATMSGYTGQMSSIILLDIEPSQ